MTKDVIYTKDTDKEVYGAGKINSNLRIIFDHYEG